MYCEKLLPTDVTGAVSDGEGQELRFAAPLELCPFAFASHASSVQDKEEIVIYLLERTYREEQERRRRICANIDSLGTGSSDLHGAWLVMFVSTSRNLTEDD